MEQCVKQCDKEYLKMAMLKQEETFKHQVHELHRLYKHQKMLLSSEKRAYQKCRNFSVNPRRLINLEKPAHEYIGRHNSSSILETDESDLELTLAIGNQRSRTKKESSITSDSTSSFSTTSTESRNVKLDRNVRDVLHMTDESNRLRNGLQIELDTKEQMRQDGPQKPPWLFQCISRNLTL